jgi:hypothetical protein
LYSAVAEQFIQLLMSNINLSFALLLPRTQAKAVQGWITPTMFDGGYSPYTGQSGTRPTHTIEGLGHAVDYLASYGGGL